MIRHALLGAILLSLLGVQIASASLILETYQTMGGTGLGKVSTILTFQNNGTEAGCVGLGGATGLALLSDGSCSPGGDTKHGNSQTGLQPLSAAGITGTGAAGAAEFGMVFNPVQPGSSAGLDVSALIVAFFSSDGQTLLYETTGALGCQTTAGGPITSAPCYLPPGGQGTGNSGFLVVLDAAQQADAVAAGAFSSVDNLIGVSAAAGSDAYPSAGGAETTFLVNANGTPPPDVPEPGTCLLIGSGMAFAGLARRLRIV